MELADVRSGGASPSVRKSLRAHKATPQYRAMLEGVIQRREMPGMSDLERRRVRLDRILAREELSELKRGKSLSEFFGVISLRDPLAGLHEEGSE